MSERKAFPYTVLMLKPQSLAAPYGKDIVLYHVDEDSPDEAIVEAQQQAFEAHETEDQDPADWHVLAVIEGHHDNMAPPPEPLRLVKLMPADHAFLMTVLGDIDVRTPSAARSAMVTRIIRKLARHQVAEDGAPITFSENEYRVLNNLLWETTKRTDDPQMAKAADKIWGTMVTALPMDQGEAGE